MQMQSSTWLHFAAAPDGINPAVIARGKVVGPKGARSLVTPAPQSWSVVDGQEKCMKCTTLAIVGGVLFFLVPAHAHDPSPETENGRYSFNRVEEGFLRLDHRTGQVSLCDRRAVGWACQAIPDERTALESEIMRLQNENATLKRELLSHNLPLPGAMKDNAQADSQAARRGEPTLRLPSDEDLDRVKNFIENVWRRLVEMMMNFQKDLLRKT
jgi:hypothetical protein